MRRRAGRTSPVGRRTAPKPRSSPAQAQGGRRPLKKTSGNHKPTKHQKAKTKTTAERSRTSVHKPSASHPKSAPVKTASHSPGKSSTSRPGQRAPGSASDAEAHRSKPTTKNKPKASSKPKAVHAPSITHRSQCCPPTARRSRSGPDERRATSTFSIRRARRRAAARPAPAWPPGPSWRCSVSRRDHGVRLGRGRLRPERPRAARPDHLRRRLRGLAARDARSGTVPGAVGRSAAAAAGRAAQRPWRAS